MPWTRTPPGRSQLPPAEAVTSKINVLLVDDNPDVRFLVRRALEDHASFAVAGEAADGAEAIEASGRLQPDVVLLDLDMPGMDGLAALPAIRSASPDARVVVLSALNREQMEPATLAGGAVGYLEKGLSPRQLVDELLALSGVMATVEEAFEAVRSRLAGEPRSAGSARRIVDEALRRWECDEILDVVTLLVSEVVTNAVVHARTDVELAVLLLPTTVRIEVHDRSGGQPDRQPPDPTSESGRGLGLVEELSVAWGTSPAAVGKTVWFEVPRIDQAPAGA